MGRTAPHSSVVTCRLFAAETGGVELRVIELHYAPETMEIADELTGCVELYERAGVSPDGSVAFYVFEGLA